MNIILVGESGSGKTSVAKALKNAGYERVVAYTTRPIRENEKDGVDYHFVNEGIFASMAGEQAFLETAEYNKRHYGTGKDSFKQPGNKVAILTPHGMRRFKKSDVYDKGKDFIVHITAPRAERLIKLLERGDDVEEAYRRSLSDVGMFDGVADEVNVTLCNNGYIYSPEQIAIQILDYIRMRREDSVIWE